MKYEIDPLVDPVFKAIFGRQENKNLLIHFLNALLAHGPQPTQSSTDTPHAIEDIELLDPHHLRRNLMDKLTIVDVKARDQKGHLYQLEVQVVITPALQKRMYFTWSQLISEQLQRGDSYPTIKPAQAIWLLKDSLFDVPGVWHHKFRLYDEYSEVKLDTESAIHLLQLKNWNGRVECELERWLYFLREGYKLDIQNLPEIMQTREMRQAMAVLNYFSEDDHALEAYRRAERSRRWERTLLDERDNALKAQQEAEAHVRKLAAEHELVQREVDMLQRQASAEKKRAELLQREAEAEIQRLRALLDQNS